MPLSARLVPWSLAGLSLVVLGTLVLINPFFQAAPATVGSAGARGTAPSWMVGLALIMVGSLAALATMFRQPRGPV